MSVIPKSENQCWEWADEFVPSSPPLVLDVYTRYRETTKGQAGGIWLSIGEETFELTTEQASGLRAALGVAVPGS